jgi:transposase-like protein
MRLAKTLHGQQWRVETEVVVIDGAPSSKSIRQQFSKEFGDSPLHLNPAIQFLEVQRRTREKVEYRTLHSGDQLNCFAAAGMAARSAIDQPWRGFVPQTPDNQHNVL